MKRRTYRPVQREEIANRQKKQPHRFVVGYAGNNQDAVYSKKAWAFPDGEGGLSPMTALQAKRHMKVLVSSGCRAYVYELVPRLLTTTV